MAAGVQPSQPAQQLSRCVVDAVLSTEECAQLKFVHGALAVLGYRTQVTSLTLSDVLCSYPEFLIPMVNARQKAWTAVEKALGMEFELYPEFTSLIAWAAGSSLNWHTDENRDYLKQRYVSAVCYLNQAGTDFEGGNLMFRSPAEEVAPAPGRLVCFLATEEHAVQAIESGERQTLTLWFTRNQQACEDLQVLKRLGQISSPPGLPESMYLVDGGDDVRLMRLRSLGIDAGQLACVASQQAAGTGGLSQAPLAQAPHQRAGRHACMMSDAAMSWICNASCLEHACLRAHFFRRLLDCQEHTSNWSVEDWENALNLHLASLKAQLVQSVPCWTHNGLLLCDTVN